MTEFTQHQRDVFCVFSGQGVTGLRRHLLQMAVQGPQLPDGPITFQNGNPGPGHHIFGGPAALPVDNSFEEADAIDDDDMLDEGSEMVIDTAPFAGNNYPLHLTNGNGLALVPPPPPPPPAPALGNSQFAPSYTPTAPPLGPAWQLDDADDVMDGVSTTPASMGRFASTAPVGGIQGGNTFNMTHHPAPRVASGAGLSLPGAGPSTATVPGASSAQSQTPTSQNTPNGESGDDVQFGGPTTL